MKGLLHTSIILKQHSNKEVGLRPGNILSHVAVFDIEAYDRLFLLQMQYEPAPDVM